MNRFHRTARAEKAFTLLELLVVVAIIAILAAILFPVFGRARENARKSSCQSNLKQIGLGLLQYTQDFDEGLPFPTVGKTSRSEAPVGDALSGYIWQDAIFPYVKSEPIFNCPSQSFATTSTALLPLPFRYSNPSLHPNGPAVRDVSSKSIGSYSINASYQRSDITDFAQLPPVTSVSSPVFRATLNNIPAPTTTVWVGEHNGFTGGDPIHVGPVSFGVISKSVSPGWVLQTSAGPDAGDYPALGGYLEARLSQRHLETTNVLFCDGHVKAMKFAALTAPSSRDTNLYRYFTSWDD